MKKAVPSSQESPSAPDLSAGPILNCFLIEESFRSLEPMAVLLDTLCQEGEIAARVDLLLPLGCPFSLFVVRGYPRGAECPALMASLVVSRDLATALAANLEQASILEVPIAPPPL